MSTRFGFLMSTVMAASVIGAGVSAANADDMAAQNAKTTIVQAIEAAEAKGGKATEVEFSDDNGGRWEVKVVADGGNKLTEYYVDSNSGQVTGQEEQTYEKYFTMLKPENFEKAQVQLKAAVTAAEAFAKGKAVDAEVERDSDAVKYEITVAMADGKSKDVNVDAMGKATAD